MKKIFAAAITVLSMVAMMAGGCTKAQAANGCYEPLQCCSPDYADREQVDEVVDLLKNTSFDDERYKIAIVCVDLCDMDTNSLRKIAKCFSFDDKRLKFLEYAIECCCNIEDYADLRDTFTFNSNKDKFLEFVDYYRHKYPQEWHNRW